MRNKSQEKNQQGLVFRPYNPKNIQKSIRYKTWKATVGNAHLTLLINETRNGCRYDLSVHSRRKVPDGINVSALPEGTASSFEKAKQKVKSEFNVHHVFPKADIPRSSTLQIKFSNKQVQDGYF